MSCDLAVMAPFLGRTTETALRRHMCELAPGRTAVLALTAPPDERPDPELAASRCLILEDGVKYLIKPPSSAREIARVLDKARRFLLKHRVKAILSEYLDFSTYFIGLADELKIPFVAHAHGADASQRLREPEWRRRYVALAKASAIVVVSHAMKRALEASGFDPERIRVIPCGVEVADTPPPPRPHRRFRCLAVGRMTAKKAPILLLDAFRRALPDMAGARLDFVGDGPLLSAVHQCVKVMALEDSVTLHGERSHDEVLRLVREADVFVQHSCVDPLTGDAEGLPAAILEAMADGLPVVSTLHAGIPEAVEDGVTGFLVPEGDTPAMAARLVDLARDPDLRRTMGQSGWARVRRMFSWELEKDRLLDVLGLRQAAPEALAVLTRT
jgi:colanic acid/amylovoran biosynthesis glycosyltransferase